MSDDLRRLPTLHPGPTPSLGSMIGTPIVGGVEYFTRTYGQAAANEIVARVPAQWAELLRPDVPSLGVLGARRYPYAFVGDLVYTMRTVANHPDEDRLIR